MIRLFLKYKLLLVYSSALAILMVLIQWMQWKFVLVTTSWELYISFIAVLFTCLGIWLALQLNPARREIVVVEKEVVTVVQPEKGEDKPAEISVERPLPACELSQREMEVLELLATGMSNQEMAEALFVSVNTVKTHLSNIFLKLDVKRRTQAIDAARRLKLIA